MHMLLWILPDKHKIQLSAEAFNHKFYKPNILNFLMAEKFLPYLNGIDFFEEKYAKGYTEVVFGGEGILIGNSRRKTRIIRLVAVFHPTRYFKSVATSQDSNFYCGIHEDRGKSFEENYTRRNFEEYIAKNKIPISDRQNLLEILNNFN